MIRYRIPSRFVGNDFESRVSQLLQFPYSDRLGVI